LSHFPSSIAHSQYRPTWCDLWYSPYTNTYNLPTVQKLNYPVKTSKVPTSNPHENSLTKGKDAHIQQTKQKVQKDRTTNDSHERMTQQINRAGDRWPLLSKPLCRPSRLSDGYRHCLLMVEIVLESLFIVDFF
jgi:hypothetical protein